MEQAGTRLEQVVVDSLRRLPLTDAPLIAWPLVCGSTVAERTRATRFHEGILEIEVSDSRWKRELQELAPRYLAQINRYLGQRVTRLEFVVRNDTR